MALINHTSIQTNYTWPHLLRGPLQAYYAVHSLAGQRQEASISVFFLLPRLSCSSVTRKNMKARTNKTKVGGIGRTRRNRPSTDSGSFLDSLVWVVPIFHWVFIEAVCGNQLPGDAAPIFRENKSWIIFASQTELHLWKRGGQQGRTTELWKHTRVVGEKSAPIHNNTLWFVKIKIKSLCWRHTVIALILLHVKSFGLGIVSGTSTTRLCPVLNANTGKCWQHLTLI